MSEALNLDPRSAGSDGLVALRMRSCRQGRLFPLFLLEDKLKDEVRLEVCDG